MSDLEEMKAHNVGLQMMKEEATAVDRPLTEAFIRNLHHTLLRCDYEEQRTYDDGTVRRYTVHAGIYKTRPNSVKTVTGEIFTYASPEETPALMSDLVAWYNEAEKKAELSPIELAAVFHYRYIRIHPFEDGNGRIARLLVNFILHRHGWPMIVVKTADKENYLTALNRCDIAVGDIPADGAHAAPAVLTPFIDYMADCLERALKLNIRAAKGESIEEEDDLGKELAILDRQIRHKTEAMHRDLSRKSPDNVRDVAEFVVLPLVERLKSLLTPFGKWFDEVKAYAIFEPWDLMCRVEAEMFDAEPSLRLKRALLESSGIKIHYSLSTPSQESLGTLSFNGALDLRFEDEYYIFADQQYPYSQFPEERTADSVVAEIKEKILAGIRAKLAE